MLPLSLLNAASMKTILVEVKSEESYNGHLISCDSWMNVHLKDVICTSKDGDQFWKMSECFIRGSTIKYLIIPEDVIENVKEENLKKPKGKSFGKDNDKRTGVSKPKQNAGSNFKKNSFQSNKPKDKK